MSRRAGASFVALLTSFAAAAWAVPAPRTGDLGTVLTAEAASDPFADDAGGAGSLVIVYKDGHTAGYSVIGTTRLTRDGKKVAFDPAMIGDLVARAEFDPNTKTLAVLDLMSPEAAASAKKEARPAAKGKPAVPAVVMGEVAFTDALRGTLSVRAGNGRMREFAVAETTVVLRQTADGRPRAAGFETVSVGDSVEIRSRDGKNADQIRVRPAAR